MLLLVLGVATLGLAVFLVGEVATLPARQRQEARRDDPVRVDVVARDRDPPARDLAAIAVQRIEQLRAAAMSPLRDRRTAEILEVAVRSLEAVHAHLTGPMTT